MSRPLTIEQLKALKIDDWVWIDFRDIYPYYVGQVQTGYYKISLQYEDEPYEITDLWLYGEDFIIQLKYSDYGTKWLAYKNKEEAEGKYDSLAEQAKKQTAKEIFDKLKKEIVTGCEETGSGLSIYDCGWAYMSCVLWTSIVEIAKNYGIELKEVDE